MPVECKFVACTFSSIALINPTGPVTYPSLSPLLNTLLSESIRITRPSPSMDHREGSVGRLNSVSSTGAFPSP